MDIFQLFQTKEQYKLFQTKEQYKISHQLNYNDKCLIYLLSCKVFGLQYVYSTTDKFRLRWNNYKENNWKVKRGGDICSHFFLSIFLQIIITAFYKIAVLLLWSKQMGLIPLDQRNTGEEFWRLSPTLVEHNRLIVLSGQMFKLKIFQGKGIYIIKYILLTYIISSICCLCLDFVFHSFIIIIILSLLLLLLLPVLLLISLLLLLLFKIATTILQWCYSSPLCPVCK